MPVASIEIQGRGFTVVDYGNGKYVVNGVVPDGLAAYASGNTAFIVLGLIAELLREIGQINSQ